MFKPTLILLLIVLNIGGIYNWKYFDSHLDSNQHLKWAILVNEC